MEIRVTHDGSHTLYNPQLNENYHSVNGAVDESNHVFVEAGLRPVLKEKKGIYLLEVGFGTGLNAWLSVCDVQEHFPESLVSYVAIEPNPIPDETVAQLNYSSLRNGTSHAGELYYQLHQAPWETETKVLKNQFHIRKLPVRLEDFKPYWLFDLIYYDAFAPNKQPEMWDKALFQRLYDITVPGGVLVTYCAKGQFKRDLREIGWEVESLPGPTGKREMTRAVKPLTAPV
ncbi:MAG: tRNA (5-methylaminomethyl-2-thiouridine)(34)-methyltransferase MnmD [Cytophagales bacterium]|nr:tRNA (5-methylaminomethyl-2-thiouridine)(34)-methyltransferase MnmD [Cytophagales bacterium]